MIELIVLDVDGCMTDGSIIYDNSGNEIKSFNVKDGLAIASWIRLGKRVAIITGRSSKIVEKRAKELGVTYLYQNVKDKELILNEIIKKENFSLENVAAIGDDLNDIKLLLNAKLSFTPHDGSKYLEESIDIRLETNGGRGAVREMIEYIIKVDNLEREFIELWQ